MKFSLLIMPGNIQSVYTIVISLGHFLTKSQHYKLGGRSFKDMCMSGREHIKKDTTELHYGY